MKANFKSERDYICIDPFTNSTVVESKEHLMVHLGKYFITTRYFTGIAPNVPFYIGYQTGEKVIHYKPTAINSNCALLKVEFFEEANWSGGVESDDITNKNRMSDNVHTLGIFYNPTVVGEGTNLLKMHLIGSVGVGQSRSGGSNASEEEWVFKPNTKYLAKYTNLDSVNCSISALSTWYEGGVRDD